MAWTTPKTWTAALVTVAEFNEQIRDNLAALKDPPTDSHLADELADWSTTSTSFVDVDATDLALTISTNGGAVIVHFYGTVNAPAGGGYFDIDVDGTSQAGDDGLIRAQASATSAVSFSLLIEGLSAASHTFKLRWKSGSANTLTLYAGAGTAVLDLHPQFWVREVS